MARQARGQVVEDPRRPGLFGLRFRAGGQRRYLGLGQVTRAEAEQELRGVLAEVERGLWQPAQASPAPEARQNPSSHEFASEWLERHRGECRPRTIEDYEWQLTHHLLPFFSRHALSRITVAEVDRYRTAELRERVLAPGTINKTLTRLGQILKEAVEYRLLERKPAKGRRQRLKVPRPSPVWLDRADQIEALLGAAGESQEGLIGRGISVEGGSRRGPGSVLGGGADGAGAHGAVAGERRVRAFDRALERTVPAVLVSAVRAEQLSRIRDNCFCGVSI